MKTEKLPGQIVIEMEVLSKQVESLFLVIQDIGVRLESIMTPPPITVIDECKHEELVPLATDIRRLSDLIRDARKRLVEINERVQL